MQISCSLSLVYARGIPASEEAIVFAFLSMKIDYSCGAILTSFKSELSQENSAKYIRFLDLRVDNYSSRCNPNRYCSHSIRLITASNNPGLEDSNLILSRM